MHGFLYPTLLAALLLASASAARLDALVAYWDFEDARGTANSLFASGGSAFDGSLQGNALRGGTPRVGAKALRLDGDGDYLDVTSVVAVNQPWTVSAWFRCDNAPTGRRFVFESSGSYALSYGLDQGAPASNTLFQHFTQGGGATPVPSDFSLPDTQVTATWHHILLCHTPATATQAGRIVGYLDGVQRHTVTIPAGGALANASGLHLGTYRSADGRWFQGSIDEVALWQRTLGATEAAEIHQLGLDGKAVTDGFSLIRLAASPPQGGAVTGDGVFVTGATRTLTAVPNPNWVFSGWQGDLAGQPATVQVNAANIQATATFIPDPADDDGDGLSNFEELTIHGTDPHLADTDGDGLSDGDEVNLIGTSPLNADTVLVNAFRQYFDPSQAGIVALSTPRLTTTAAGIRVGVGLLLSTDGGDSWNPLPLGAATVEASGDHWRVTVPVPAMAPPAFRLQGAMDPD